jgi:ketosteroid isomerase-like protein
MFDSESQKKIVSHFSKANQAIYRHRIRILVGVVAACLICVTSFRSPMEADDSPDLSRELSQSLQEQSEAWNRGDLRGFMSAYWNSPNMTFSSGGTTARGWQPTLDRYLKKYPNREAMGHLTFRNLETSQLSPDVALMLGEWHLTKEEPAQGNFSLVWKRFDEGWRIVHDHSSLASEKPIVQAPPEKLVPSSPTLDQISPSEADPVLQIDAPNRLPVRPAVMTDDVSNDPVFQELKRAFLNDSTKSGAKEPMTMDASEVGDVVWHSAEQLLTAARKLEAEEGRFRSEGNPQRAFAIRKTINAIRGQVTALLLTPEEK